LAVKEFVVVEGSGEWTELHQQVSTTATDLISLLGNDSWAPGHQRGLELIDEARLFLRTMPQQFGVANEPSFNGPSLPPTSYFGSRSRQASSSQQQGHSPRSPTDSSFSSASRNSTISPSSLGTSSFTGTPPSLNEVLKYLPSRERAHSAYR